MNYLVIGAAGFIGAKVSEDLLKKGIDVVGLDVINDYYDVSLEEERGNRREKSPTRPCLKASWLARHSIFQ